MNSVIIGVHGNELTGVQVIQKILKACPELTKGKLTLAIGNPKAVLQGTRGSRQHADLNRCFTLRSDYCLNLYENSRADVLKPFLQVRLSRSQ